jgi:transforming growth factor-beta-induced protein
MLVRMKPFVCNAATLLVAISAVIFNVGNGSSNNNHALFVEATDSIAAIACGLDDFSILCDLVVKAGLDGILSDPGSFTVFAPTNAAFEEILEIDAVADLVENDIGFVTEVLLYHVIADKVLKERDLDCTELYDMANGSPTRHVCSRGQRFQRGSGNSNADPPKIAAFDVEASNGVIHVVEKVILPGPSPDPSPVASPTRAPGPTGPSGSCGTTLADVACSVGDLSILCKALRIAGLDDVVDDEDTDFTVFAPTNKAFQQLLGCHTCENTLRHLDRDTLTDILLFHVVVGDVIKFNDLKCNRRITMANGETTKTVCSSHRLDPFGKAQKGPGNPDHYLPVIVIKDVEACNGIAHVIDEVILPGGH